MYNEYSREQLKNFYFVKSSPILYLTKTILHKSRFLEWHKSFHIQYKNGEFHSIIFNQIHKLNQTDSIQYNRIQNELEKFFWERSYVVTEQLQKHKIYIYIGLLENG